MLYCKRKYCKFCLQFCRTCLLCPRRQTPVSWSIRPHCQFFKSQELLTAMKTFLCLLRQKICFTRWKDSHKGRAVGSHPIRGDRQTPFQHRRMSCNTLILHYWPHVDPQSRIQIPTELPIGQISHLDIPRLVMQMMRMTTVLLDS